MALPPIVALEIGTSKVIVLVGEARQDGNVMITGIGECTSSGIRKGSVTDVENAEICVRSALESAEDSGKVSIRQVHLAFSGGHVQSMVNRGTIPLLEDGGEITQDDVEQVMDVARAVSLPPDRDVLHTVCQQFTIDDHHTVVRPEGMEGSKLAVDMLIIHALRNQIRNTAKVVGNLLIEVADIAFSGLCSSLAVLTPEQKKSGAIVIDMGAGTTDYCVYSSNVMATAGAIGIGGDHITNDVAVALNIPLLQAEQLKRNSGGAISDVSSAFQKVSIPPEVGFPGRTISLKDLCAVINARAEETLQAVRRRMEENGKIHHIGAGVILTGGGARLKGITRLVENVFGLPCSIGKPRNVSGLSLATDGAEYATCCGLLQYAYRMLSEERKASSIRNLFRGLLGK